MGWKCNQCGWSGELLDWNDDREELVCPNCGVEDYSGKIKMAEEVIMDKKKDGVN